MCGTRLDENTGCKKSPQIRHLGTIAQVCRAVSSQLRHVSIIREKLVKQQYLLHMFPQYGELRPTNGWDWFGSLRHPSKFQRFRILPSLLQRRRSVEANQTLHDVWPSPGLVHYIRDTFSGALAPWRNFARCISQTLRRGTRNGITELLQRVPLIFGRAAITLGICPHSSHYNKTVIRLLIKHNQHFYLDVSVSARDLHLVQFFFQFLPW